MAMILVWNLRREANLLLALRWWGRVSVLRLMPISCWESFSVRKCVQKPVMPKRLMPGRVIELLSKETNAGYMWNTPGSCEFHVEKTGATFG